MNYSDRYIELTVMLEGMGEQTDGRTRKSVEVASCQKEKGMDNRKKNLSQLCVYFQFIKLVFQRLFFPHYSGILITYKEGKRPHLEKTFQTKTRSNDLMEGKVWRT